jgi:uncharacterized protein with PQ loop repeat
MATPSLATQYAPSLRLVAAHLALGIVGFVGFSCALLLRASTLHGHFFQPQILGLVHLCVLGWLMPITLGALHQLIPVVFEAKVRSERIPWVALVLYVMGASGLIAHLWLTLFDSAFVISAGLLVLALYLYLGNLGATLFQGGARTLTGAYVIAAFSYLALAAGLGFALALHLHASYLSLDHLRLLRVHAHAAGLGFFGLLIMGVSFRLLEMFLIAYVKREDAGWLALVFINVSLLALGAHHLLAPSSGWLVVSVVAAVLGIAAFLVQVRRVYRARMRKRTDLPWRHTAASFSYLVIAAVIAAVTSTASLDSPLQERLQLAYGFVALPGFIGSVIVGQLHKILPFLVWFHRFSPYVGLRAVPAASELLPEPPQRVQWFLMHGGIVGATLGLVLAQPVLVVVGSGAFMLSSLLFARNMWVVYRSHP